MGKLVSEGLIGIAIERGGGRRKEGSEGEGERDSREERREGGREERGGGRGREGGGGREGKGGSMDERMIRGERDCEQRK